MSEPEYQFEKTALRKFLLNRRSSYTKDQKITNNLHIHIQPLIKSFGGNYVSVFQAYNNEIDTSELINYLLSRNISICLPSILESNKKMVFRTWSKGENLIKGKFGILEPETSKEIVIPSILLMPLLAFDENGNRLGYGGGFYDKFIAEMEDKDQNLLKIGVAFSFQKIQQVPTDIHDKKLDWILTEKYLYKA
ncbi:MAG: 5-formyltetrahydrofolate cyclo-ligase [Candidatus Pelagibacterales bacterium]|jgi:5-formyltetrahydrofolate cyclo-ligase|tara:strand:+ start:255 stop:833 length:579 start_codon:yes stop_codon:yes gene_type:complete